MNSQTKPGESTKNADQPTLEWVKKKYQLKNELEDLEMRLRSKQATLMNLRLATTMMKIQKASLEEKVERARKNLEKTVAKALDAELKVENAEKDYRKRIEGFVTKANDYAKNLEENLFGESCGGGEVAVESAKNGENERETREMRKNTLRIQIEAAKTYEGYQREMIAQLREIEKYTTFI